MNTVIVVFLLAALVGCAGYVLVGEWFRESRHRLDLLVEDTLGPEDRPRHLRVIK
jgi:hypothetical protein